MNFFVPFVVKFMKEKSIFAFCSISIFTLYVMLFIVTYNQTRAVSRRSSDDLNIEFKKDRFIFFFWSTDHKRFPLPTF
jgi:hypothetical protein